jgi:aspartate racemase
MEGLEMKMIGVLGGSSPVSTREYYRQLDAGVRSRLGGWNSAKLVIYSTNFQFSVDCVRGERWDELGNHLVERTAALVNAGAELLICASNTWHRCAPAFTAGLKIPFLHIVDTAAAAIQAKGLNRVALFGTKQVMTLDFMIGRYEKFGIEVIAPEGDDLETIDRIIFDELCHDKFTSQSKIAFLKIAERLRGRGAQGLILGCTEIPLLIRQEDEPSLPMFDTTALHVEASIDLALSGEETQLTTRRSSDRSLPTRT